VISVIGGGLSGSEAAWQAANRGIRVRLHEMRPGGLTPGHRTGFLAEMICSNSLKSIDPLSAHGMLKHELRAARSLLMEAADASAIPGGKALVVDRRAFAGHVTEKISNHPGIKIIREEVSTLPPGVCVIATGPLTSDALLPSLAGLAGREFLYFYDAQAPVFSSHSLDTTRMFWADRYGLDQRSYLNIPLDGAGYRRFWEALVSAELHIPHLTEDRDIPYFEGCLPIEVMAKRGYETLAYGPLRPSGLPDPRTGHEPFAVAQLRPENAEATAFSLVGFQTQLKQSEQERVFRLLPGMENAEFLRHGAVHRNTYLDAPGLLLPTLQMCDHPEILVAGQLSGTEGYTEAIAGGLVAGVNAARLVSGLPALEFPRHSAMGALIRGITTYSQGGFQPLNMNLGLFSDVPQDLRGRQRREFIAKRAKREFGAFLKELKSL